ncbi:acyl carrier protein [Thermocrispum municipale]|jgi:acyl carrier protein|uniref:acyl carrier protein n=1 Tax=Thermocrispum municipale TaxID=37926 RepID=UPI000420E8C0|nr:acyl carrier protein [Thermocrispum municipale]
MSTIHERLVTILAEWSTAAPESITPDSDLESGLDIDSLSRLEFVLALRKEFGIPVTDEEVFAARTVGDVQELVAAALQSEQPAR